MENSFKLPRRALLSGLSGVALMPFFSSPAWSRVNTDEAARATGLVWGAEGDNGQDLDHKELYRSAVQLGKAISDSNRLPGGFIVPVVPVLEALNQSNRIPPTISASFVRSLSPGQSAGTPNAYATLDGRTYDGSFKVIPSAPNPYVLPVTFTASQLTVTEYVPFWPDENQADRDAKEPANQLALWLITAPSLTQPEKWERLAQGDTVFQLGAGLDKTRLDMRKAHGIEKSLVPFSRTPLAAYPGGTYDLGPVFGLGARRLMTGVSSSQRDSSAPPDSIVMVNIGRAPVLIGSRAMGLHVS